MSINRAEHTLEDRLVNDITELKKDLRELKTIQPVGADILSVVGTLPISTAIVLDPGLDNARGIIFNLIPPAPQLQLVDVYSTLYIDTDADVDHVFSGGISLTAAQRRIRYTPMWPDWGSSNDVSGARVFRARLENADTVQHTVYFYIRAYFLKGGVGGYTF